VERYKRKKEAGKGKNIKNDSKSSSNGTARNVKEKKEKQFANNFAIPGQSPAPIVAQNEWDDKRKASAEQNPSLQKNVGQNQNSYDNNSFVNSSNGQSSFGNNNVQYGSNNDRFIRQDYSEAEMPQLNQSYDSNYGETRPLGPSDATICMDDGTGTFGQAVSPYLINKKNGDKIIINKDVFRIGREVNYVDYCIQNNRAIGRSHAFIKSQNGKYYGVDTNSLNHTYVNGVEIKPQTETEITHGTELRFANENYEFKLY
jgi:hypothetical protein